MAEAPPQETRTLLLSALVALGCEAEQADGLHQFVMARALLLSRLEAHKAPWTAEERALLQQALMAGAEVLLRAEAQRRSLAQKINALRGFRRPSPAPLGPPRIRRTL